MNMYQDNNHGGDSELLVQRSAGYQSLLTDRDASSREGPVFTSTDSAARPQTACSAPEARRRVRMFRLFITLQILINYDSGAIAAALDRLATKEPPGFDLSLTQSGLLSSLVYMGLSLASLLAGPLLQKYSQKWVLCCTLLFNISANALFAWAVGRTMLLGSRFLVGFSQAFLVIYAPVWVDEFAPSASCTLWMSLMQAGPLWSLLYHHAGVPLGVMLGYLVSGLLTAYMPRLDPRWPFRIQVLLLIPVVLVLCCVPSKYLDIRLTTGHRTGENLSEEDEADGYIARRVDTLDVNDIRNMSIWDQFAGLALTPVYFFTTMALCALYFVVTGIQLWVTAYLVNYIAPHYGGFEKQDVVYAFAATSCTGPILGVLFGGWLCDQVGGYRNSRGVRDAARLATCFSVLAVMVAIPVIWATKLYVIIFLIWLLLFWGGAILPAATGILMSCVPRNMRSFSSSTSTLLYNWLGYFGGPTLSGVVSDAWGGVEWGMRVILCWSVFGFIFISCTLAVAQRSYAKSLVTSAPEITEEECRDRDTDWRDLNTQDRADLQYEMARECRQSLLAFVPRSQRV
eukprot:Ihof_evm5s7 gene=Ihof_evmTU5s7